MNSRSRGVFAPVALAFWMAASPSARLAGGGTPNGLSNKLMAMPQYAMAQSGSALITSSKISFDARYQNECW